MAIKICPKCKSKDLNYNPRPIELKGGLPISYKCNSCGYYGPVFDIEETKKNEKHKR